MVIARRLIVLVPLALVSAPGQAAQPQPTRLQASSSETRGISGPETHEYRIALKAGQALHVVVNQLGVDVVVVVSGPEGEPVEEVDSPTSANGPESVWVVASKTGDYALRVRPLRTTGSGRYELRVEAIRGATADDERRIEMMRALSTYSRLWTEGNHAVAIQHLKKAAAAARTIKDTTTATIANGQLLSLDRRSALESLGLSSRPGALPVYYNRAYGQRALGLQEQVTHASKFLSSKLEVEPTIALAVLSREDWSLLLTEPPYGMPFARSPFPSPPAVLPVFWLVVMPATHEAFDVITAAMKRSGALTLNVVKQLETTTGLTFEDGMRLYYDAIMFHELGHVYVSAYGIASPNRWVGEFLATFLREAYFAESGLEPRTRAFFDALTGFMRGLQMKHTSLEDFERLYSGVGFENYGWYQVQFEKRAATVYKAQGLAFLQRVKDVFPASSKPLKPLTVEETLARLEKISPGFVEWAKDLADQRAR